MGSATAVSMRVGNSEDVWVIMRSCFSVCVSGDGGAPTRTCSSAGTRVLYEHGERLAKVFFFFFSRPGRMLNLVFLPAPAVSSTCAMKRHTRAHAALQLSRLSNNMGKHHAPSGTLHIRWLFFCFFLLCSATGNRPFNFLCKLHRERLELGRFVFFSWLERERDQSALFLGRRRCGCRRGFSCEGGKTLQPAFEEVLSELDGNSSSKEEQRADKCVQ